MTYLKPTIVSITRAAREIQHGSGQEKGIPFADAGGHEAGMSVNAAYPADE